MSGVALRPAAPGDRDQVLAWRNAPGVRANMYTSEEIAPDAHAAWFAAALEDPARRLWIITVEGRGVGVATLTDIDPVERTASWAFYIGEDDLRGRGVGAATERLVLAEAFETEKLDRLDCEVVETNARVVALHEKFGFVRTGRLKARVMRDGAPVDAIRLSLTREAWLATQEKGPADGC